MFTDDKNSRDTSEDWSRTSPNLERDSLEELREERQHSPVLTHSLRVRSPSRHCSSPRRPYALECCRIPTPTYCCSPVPRCVQMDVMPYCCQHPYACTPLWMRSSPTPQMVCHTPNYSRGEDSWRKYFKPQDQSEECQQLQEKLQTLENDKQNLLLQVNVLTEQIDIQTDKIQELETELQKKKKQLANSEEMLQQEIMSRASLENSRLDLLTEISSLRLQLAASQQKQFGFEEKYKKLENELLRNRLLTKSTESVLQPWMLSTKSTAEPSTEIEKLRKTLESVMEANKDKEKKIIDLKTAVNRYKDLQEILSGEEGNDAPQDLRTSHDSLFVPSPYGTVNSKKSEYNYHSFGKPPPTPRSIDVMRPFSADLFRSSPFKEPNIQSGGNLLRPYSKTPPPRFHSSSLSRPPSFEASSFIHIPTKSVISGSEIWETPQSKSNPTSPTTQAISYQSLYNPSLDNFNTARNKRSGFMNNSWFKRKKRSNSTPELAQCEMKDFDERASMRSSRSRYSSLPTSPVPVGKEKKGFRKLFGRAKQDKFSKLNQNEQTLDRLNKEWSPSLTTDPIPKTKMKFTVEGIGVPFSNWDTDTVVEWMDEIGLGMYRNECKKWIKNGDQLLKATNANLEKELKIKNSLHRKKLRLALQTIGSESRGLDEIAGQLDYHWVISWLDDIGLPQYKDIFAEARIDGRVLHYLTVEDLITLKVTNLLHFTSIKRGIQMLRRYNFHPSCLIRRSVPNEEISANLIIRWTNHRIMEWLKTVDLSEYAPNLRGSGVHGALMVYENSFNGDLLASLLNIPSSKTLLRRHLSLRFKELLGSEVMQNKRDSENKPGFIILTPTAKIKAGRKRHFRLSFRNRSMLDMEDFVCPLETNLPDYNIQIIPQETDSKKDNEKETEDLSLPVTDTSV
ncbi:liprin-beta-1-like isoform X2 [Centruroides sculpturatus]|uniref:liprin-beta-1-like isoform X2 n=1 Tax=Centruroides sculpturatus TaxID=218467 RepID=UPI000C6CAA66|nr:liprin-beta-1-like isoform X2 [Centruroides sculpturatus]